MPTERFYAVDRIKRTHAVLIGDAGDEFWVPLSELPAALKEGLVLRVPVGPSAEVDWPEARIDEQETARRRAEAEKLLRNLHERDPGGDVQL